MDDKIVIETFARNIANVKDFLLSEEPMSRLVFKPQVHTKGIRGRIIRQRRSSKNDSWVSDQAIHIRKLGKNESINIDIPTKGIENFYSAIVQLKQILKEHGIEFGKNEYQITDLDSIIINNKNKDMYIKKLIEADCSEEILNQLTEKKFTLVKKIFYEKKQIEKQKIIDEFSVRLKDKNLLETKDNNSWQEWIYNNYWLFGIHYQQPIQKTKINITGVMPDYLFPTLDGFIDILEIKLPTDEVLIEDKNHPGSFKWAAKTNEAIGQVVNYLGEIDSFKLEIEKAVKKQYGFDISLLKPRAYILIGNRVLWNNEQREGLRKLNHALHGIEILTYKDLFDRGNQAVNIKAI